MKIPTRLLRPACWLPVLLLALLGSCRTCPIASCHVRKVHIHGGQKYRGQPLWKKQNPAIGEKIKMNEQPDGKMHNNRSKAKP